MDESRAKYCEVAVLKVVRWDSNESGEEEEESVLGARFVSAWMAVPAD